MKNQFSLLAYRNRLLLLLGVVALCGALVACQRMAPKPDPAEPVDPTPVEPTAPPLPVEAAAYVATAVEQSLGMMLRALSDPETLVVPQGTATLDTLDAETVAQAHPFAICPLESSDDATDNDGDNFAENETRSFGNRRTGNPPPPECELFSLDGFLSLFGSGSLGIDDKDDMDAASGVTLEALTEYRVTLGESESISITLEVSFDVSRSAGAADYEIDHEGTVSVAYPFSRSDVEGHYDATLTGSFASGTVGVQGGFTFSTTPADCSTLDAALQEACQEAVQEVESGGFTPQVSTSDLAYDTAACATTFTGGSFEVRAGDSVLKSTYDGCGPATVTYNGQPLPPTPEMPS